MWSRRGGSTLCPGCGSLVGPHDKQCLSCGRAYPALWGLTAWLRSAGIDQVFLPLVMAACGALYIATLVTARPASGAPPLLSSLTPGNDSLFLFGATGAVPVFGFGRWWSVLAAGWLHGGPLHLLFNMLAARTLVPAATQLYGPARTVVIWVLACAAGGLLTSLVGRYGSGLPRPLAGSQFAVGASGALFGLIGALAYYGRRGGSRLVSAHAREWALSGLVMGLLMPRVDNWGHVGGFLGGYLASRWLDPLRPERSDHLLAALLLLLACAASVVASVVTGLPLLRD